MAKWRRKDPPIDSPIDLPVNDRSRQSVKRFTVKRIAQYFGIGIGLLAVGLTIAALTPRRWQTRAVSCEASPYRVYVAGELLHVNLIVPVVNEAYDWRGFINLEAIGRDANSNYRYLKFGWGDRDFYMNTPSLADLKISRMMRSLFMPGNPTAMHVQGYGEIPQDAAVDLRCVGLSRTDYLQLMQFLQGSFQQSQGKPIRIQDAFGESSGFYEGTGTYSLLRTCNTWAAEGLDVAGLKTPIWSALAPPILRQIP
jgi:uncharacterized protein (TIGR02117 family)